MTICIYTLASTCEYVLDSTLVYAASHHLFPALSTGYYSKQVGIDAVARLEHAFTHTLHPDSSVQADRYASNKLPAYVNEFANHKNALRDVMHSTERSIVNEPELGDVMPFLANVGSPNFLLLL